MEADRVCGKERMELRGVTMFSCEHCNWHGKQEDLSHYSDYRGEYQGHPAYERIPCCPVCGHDVYIDEE